MKNKLYFILLLFILFLTLNVNADMGPKPSITIQIKNLDTTNYIVDLFTKEDNYVNTENAKCSGITEDEYNYLYNLDFNGYISATSRDFLLWGECNGNKDFTNQFSYFGTPTEFKIVLINKDTNETKISNKITRRNYQSTIVLDAKTMKAKETIILTHVKETIINTLICLLITILVELLLSIPFKLKKHFKLIIIVNLITNLLLSISLNYHYNLLIYNNISKFPKLDIITFIILETLIFIIEPIIYIKKIKNVSKKRIIIYSCLANLITLLLSFIIPALLHINDINIGSLSNCVGEA